MHLSFLPGSLNLSKKGDIYVITIEEEEVRVYKSEKAALKKFHAIRLDMEKKYPAAELTKEQKQEALKRLIDNHIYTQVRNTMRKSKFEGETKSGRFDNR